MKRKTIGLFAVAAVMVSLSSSGVAQTRAPDEAPPEAVSRYVVGTRLGYITCSNKYRDYVDKYDRFALVNEGQNTVTGFPPSDEDYRACVQETLVKGRGHVWSGVQAGIDDSSQNCVKGLPDGVGRFTVESRPSRRRKARRVSRASEQNAGAA